MGFGPSVFWKNYNLFENHFKLKFNWIDFFFGGMHVIIRNVIRCDSNWFSKNVNWVRLLWVKTKPNISIRYCQLSSDWEKAFSPSVTQSTSFFFLHFQWKTSSHNYFFFFAALHDTLAQQTMCYESQFLIISNEILQVTHTPSYSYGTKCQHHRF